MPTLSEILASKRKPPAIQIESPEVKDIDSVMALLFLLAARNNNFFYDYILLLEFFGFRYTPERIKASTEQPSLSLLFSLTSLFSVQLPPLAASRKASDILEGVGRLLTDKQQEILLTFIERQK